MNFLRFCASSRRRGRPFTLMARRPRERRCSIPLASIALSSASPWKRALLKFGLLIPGARIPIVDEATVSPPDAYLLLAWNFIDEIMEKERAYLEGGGAFIVPVPALRVLTIADLEKAQVHA